MIITQRYAYICTVFIGQVNMNSNICLVDLTYQRYIFFNLCINLFCMRLLKSLFSHSNYQISCRYMFWFWFISLFPAWYIEEGGGGELFGQFIQGKNTVCVAKLKMKKGMGKITCQRKEPSGWWAKHLMPAITWKAHLKGPPESSVGP